MFQSVCLNMFFYCPTHDVLVDGVSLVTKFEKQTIGVQGFQKTWPQKQKKTTPWSGQPATLRCCFLRPKVGLKLENNELNHIGSHIFPYFPICSPYCSVILSICFRPIVICCVQPQQLAEVFELFGPISSLKLPELSRDIRSPPFAVPQPSGWKPSFQRRGSCQRLCGEFKGFYGDV